MNPTRIYPDSLLKVPVLNSNRTFATASTNGLSVDSIGQTWIRPDSIKLFVRFPGNVIKAIATEDSIRGLRFQLPSLAILNQNTGVQTGNWNISGSGKVGTYLDYTSQGATPSYAKGRVFYDNNSESLSYMDDISGTSIQMGQESIVRARNNTGSTITNGSLVYVSGAIGQNPTIALARADIAGTSELIGMATHDIPNNTTGKITVSGRVNELNTASLTDGAPLYLSPTVAGAYTVTPPAYPNRVVFVGYCTLSHVSQGQILISPVSDIHADEVVQNQTAVSQGGGFWLSGTGRLDGNIMRVGNTSDVTDYISIERSTVDGVLRSRSNTSTPAPITLDGSKYTFQDVTNNYNPLVIDNMRVNIDSQVNVTSIGYTAITQPPITDSVKLFIKGGVILGPRQHFASTGDLNIMGRNALTGRLETSIASQKDGPAGAPGQEIIIGNVPQAVSSSFAKLYVGDTVAVGGGYHGIGTYDVVSSSNASLGAYAAVDIRTQLVGSTGFNHYVGVQSRAVLAGTAGISNYWYGMEALATHNGSGTVANYAGLRVGNILGSGPVTNNYGILIHSQTRGTNNWNIRSESGLHFFGGTATNTASTVQVNGSFAARIVTFAGTAYTMNSIDFTLLCTNTGTVTVTLPDATTCSDRIYHIKKANSGGTNVTVQTTGGQNIDQATTASIAAWATLTVQSNGTQWYILHN